MTELPETHARPEMFTAREAAATLHELGHYEETLTTRAAALTWMFFGVAGAAIFVTYEAATHLFIGIGMPWLLSLLWIPWIGGAALLTNALWETLSLKTTVTYDRRETWLGTLGGCALVFAIGFLVWGIISIGTLALDPNAASAWAIIIGAFTAIFATYQSKRYDNPTLRTPFVLAGLAIFLTGFALAVWHPEDPASGLIAAAVDLGAYFAAGLYVYRRG